MRSIFFTMIVSGLTISSCHATITYDQLTQKAFNQMAQELYAPIYWSCSQGGTQKTCGTQIQPDELKFLWGMRQDKQITNYVKDGKFTDEFAQLYQEMVKHYQQPRPNPDKINDPELKRRALVLKELSQAKPTVIYNDFRSGTSEDKEIVSTMAHIGILIDTLYAKQNGVYGWDHNIPQDDLASKTLFYRNHGPFCLNPLTENDPDCNALPNKPKRVVAVYPSALQKTTNFCQKIENATNASLLMKPFVIVVNGKNGLTTIPYTTSYHSDMTQIATELNHLSKAIKDPKEAAFKAYLQAASLAFIDNNWYQADELWAKMNANNSKWYLRIGPDEQYWDPCNLKAGFHLSFAKINPDSILWQKKLDPLKNEMEKILADMAGPPYKVRQVNFHLPDFIDIVLNAGDSRAHVGGTVGQSLPNTGPVAVEGRGRTVVMTNLSFPDEASKQEMLTQSASLFCPKTMKLVVADPKLSNMSTILHEAAHNLGPTREYKVNGKSDSEIFGGQMASMLEELKAQTSALFFINWLVSKNMLDEQKAEQTYLSDIRWAFGHISRGMYDADGSYKTYSQLAAIQFGTFIKGGGLVWQKDEIAANGKDKGCFEVNMEKLKMNINDLEKQVLIIKAKGDSQAASELRTEMVDQNNELNQLKAIITERILRTPATTFLYSIRVD